jgi:hypothetical protein
MAFPLISIVDALVKVVDQVIPDADKKMELKLELAKLENQLMTGQMDINKEEAKHASIFVAGWRPAIGWIGAVGLGYSFIIEPIMSWCARVIFKYAGDFPALDTSSLMVLVTGMLGFGGLRTYEKYKGVSSEAPISPEASEEMVIVPEKKKKKILGVEVPPWLR